MELLPGCCLGRQRRLAPPAAHRDGGEAARGADERERDEDGQRDEGHARADLEDADRVVRGVAGRPRAVAGGGGLLRAAPVTSTPTVARSARLRTALNSRW